MTVDTFESSRDAECQLVWTSWEVPVDEFDRLIRSLYAERFRVHARLNRDDIEETGGGARADAVVAAPDEVLEQLPDAQGGTDRAGER